MANLKFYAADEMIVTFGATVFRQGLGEEEFVNIEFDSDLAVDKQGVDGEVVVGRIVDDRANITITLQQTSVHNDEMTGYAGLFRSAPGAAGGILPFSIKDPNGRFALLGQNAYVVKRPDPTFAKEPGEREWIIRCTDLTGTQGGS